MISIRIKAPIVQRPRTSPFHGGNGDSNSPGGSVLFKSLNYLCLILTNCNKLLLNEYFNFLFYIFFIHLKYFIFMLYLLKKTRDRAVWQLARLIILRSQVRILLPPKIKPFHQAYLKRTKKKLLSFLLYAKKGYVLYPLKIPRRLYPENRVSVFFKIEYPYFLKSSIRVF